VVDPELAAQLLARAEAGGVELLGPDGLLSQVTKAVLGRVLEEEMTGHLGYDKHDPADRGSGNSRNGTAPKTVLTDIGVVDLAVPRDRAGSFEPQIVRKGQTRLEGFSDRIIALYAREIATRDIHAHVREMYDLSWLAIAGIRLVHGCDLRGSRVLVSGALARGSRVAGCRMCGR
jgi:putative transposase